MKKILLVISIFLLFGCSNMSPKDKVEKYLSNYIALGDEVLSQIDTTAENENLSDQNKKIYKEVLKRQYKNLKYKIKNETINGKDAKVEVEISVYDLYDSFKKSNEYIENNTELFYEEDNIFKQDDAEEYRLSEMLKVEDTVDYLITFNLIKEDDSWVLKEPSKEILEKIHGIYNYDE